MYVCMLCMDMSLTVCLMMTGTTRTQDERQRRGERSEAALARSDADIYQTQRALADTEQIGVGILGDLGQQKVR